MNEHTGALILGGSSSGKSMYAQRLSREIFSREKISLEADRKEGPSLFYLATMAPCDSEDHARIEKHRREREGWGYETLEIPIRVGACAARVSGGVVLLDSLTTLLTNAMFAPNGPGMEAESFVFDQIRTVFDSAFYTVIVSDDLFSDGILYDEMTEAFRRQLGHLHCRIGELCRSVGRVSCGIPDFWKGGEEI